MEPRLEKCKMLAGVGVPLRALTALETATVELSDRALALQEMLCCISAAVFGLVMSSVTPSRLMVACSLSNENIRVSSSLWLKSDFDLPNTWVR